MKVAIGERWQDFLASAVETGRYTSASDVVTEALTLLQEREEKFIALRESLHAAIAEGGWCTDEELAAEVEKSLDEVFGPEDAPLETSVPAKA